ncbi:MAG: CorA family divalent cation transporter [Desulfococcaceae bacterium]
MAGRPSNPLVFFLGGGDAEMAEIRAILQAQNIPFHDRQLRWGARLSEYRDELAQLPPNAVPVLVELEPDIPPPPGAVVVDHHDQRAGRNKPTSLEQVADLLDLSLNRRQKLIAASDLGHIRAMRAMGATVEEIADIRSADRKAQGVTPEDEAAAAESIARHLRKTAPGTALVDSQTNRTSPIADRLFDTYSRLFIRTPDGATHFFGDGATIRRLRHLCERRDPSPRHWFGGELPDHGFFGVHARLADPEINRMSRTTPHSHHIFLFPFTIRSRDNADRSFMETVESALASYGWIPSPFHSEAAENQEKSSLDEAELRLRYSEMAYFHPFVRPAIFGESDDDGAPVMRYFTHPHGAGGEFRFTFQGWGMDAPEEYVLEVQDIALRIYDTRVGVLSLELNNWDRSELADVLRINDSARRIYPQFLGRGGIEPTKRSFLPERAELVLNRGPDGPRRIPETFPEAEFRSRHHRVAEYIHHLLGKHFTTNPGEFQTGHARFLFRPTIDDRMFTVCWYGSDRWSGLLKRRGAETRFAYEESLDWYRFIFVDGANANCQHPDMLRRLIRESTYERWAEYGTLFGISRYSLMAVTDRGFMATEVLREHMLRQYAQIAVVLLAQRASILRFSEAVSEISGRIRAAEGDAGENAEERKSFQLLSQELEELQGAFIRFVNRLWFTEITPQEQGMEMYDQAVRVMRLEEHMADLKAEIKDLYEYIGIRRDRVGNRQIQQLTILGSVFLPLTLLTGFFGMNLSLIEGPFPPWLTEWIETTFPFTATWLESAFGYPRLTLLFLLLAGAFSVFAVSRRILLNIAGGDPWIARFLGFGKLLKALFRAPDSGGKRK